MADREYSLFRHLLFSKFDEAFNSSPSAQFSSLHIIESEDTVGKFGHGFQVPANAKA
jgi:hypothetical protein